MCIIKYNPILCKPCDSLGKSADFYPLLYLSFVSLRFVKISDFQRILTYLRFQIIVDAFQFFNGFVLSFHVCLDPFLKVGQLQRHLYNGIELDIAQNIVDLIDIGITAVMVDTTLMDKKGASEAVNRAVRARDLALSERKAISKRSNTTTGHLFRGVS